MEAGDEMGIMIYALMRRDAEEINPGENAENIFSDKGQKFIALSKTRKREEYI